MTEAQQVVVHGTDGKFYIGKVEDEEFEKLKLFEPCRLKDVYQLLVIDQQLMHAQTQQFGGMSRTYILLNVGSAEGALPELNLRPATWYDPETCGVADNISKMIEAAEKATERAESPPTIVRAGAGALNALQGRIGLGGRPNGGK